MKKLNIKKSVLQDEFCTQQSFLKLNREETAERIQETIFKNVKNGEKTYLYFDLDKKTGNYTKDKTINRIKVLDEFVKTLDDIELKTQLKESIENDYYYKTFEM